MSETGLVDAAERARIRTALDESLSATDARLFDGAVLCIDVEPAVVKRPPEAVPPPRSAAQSVLPKTLPAPPPDTTVDAGLADWKRSGTALRLLRSTFAVDSRAAAEEAAAKQAAAEEAAAKEAEVEKAAAREKAVAELEASMLG